MQFITTLKLKELEKQRAAYEEYASVIVNADAKGDDLPRKLEMLLQKVQSWTGSGAVDESSTVAGKLNLSNLEMWIAQAKKDPGFSQDVLNRWKDSLEEYIKNSQRKFDGARLFGNLLTEWLDSGDSRIANGSRTDVSAEEQGEHFVEVGRTELHEQVQKFNSIVFEAMEVDVDAIKYYLTELFSDVTARKILEDLRKDMEEFSSYLEWKPITADDMRWTINSLLSTDLLDEEKLDILREFKDNELALDEMASLMNMQLGRLSTWSWPKSGIATTPRRHLNGKYRMFTDPEIPDALFLQYIGVSWQVKFKQAFLTIFRSNAWKQSIPHLTKEQLNRRRTNLNESDTVDSVEQHRKDIRENEFFLRQLPSDTNTFTSYNDSPNHDQKAPALGSNERLLHLMAMDCELNKVLGGAHTILQSDLEWFGPSLPHSTIFTFLEFFGISKPWISFFETFLRAPLFFKDDPKKEIRIRERGTPISYALSGFCGELILFGMDFAVNQRANGLFLYRNHDDLWLWDRDPVRCAAAWKEMNVYAKLVGLKFNESKTGAVCVGGAPEELPKGEVKWGFLRFDAAQARFIIDQEEITSHITELSRQLSSTKSVLGWINAYNKYMKFFVRNFGGRPAVCFGLSHVDDAIDTLARIQRGLFSGDDQANTVVGHLRRLIAERFGIVDLPQGYFYFPMSGGGLEIHDPMIEYFAVRDHIEEIHEETPLAKTMEEDENNYRILKEKWQTTTYNQQPYPQLIRAEFMPYEEYIAARETRLAIWHTRYLVYSAVAHPKNLIAAPVVEASLKTAGHDWQELNYYQQWLVSMLGEEVVQKFGGMEIVDPTLIPLVMVQLFKSSRMKWDQ
jgi:hypothetical protein